jgi:hypothetical protein
MGWRASKPLAPSHADACNPLLQAHPTWAQDKHEGRGFPLLRLSPSGFPPFALHLAPTHLGWGTRPQLAKGPPRVQGPPGSKRRQILSCPILIELAKGSFFLYVYMNFMHLRKDQLGKLVSP